jgi:2-methylcitrate dehydratase PrpD
VIDLNRVICDCADFPRAQFCKHIGAIYLHFPHLSTEKIGLTASPGPSQTQGNAHRVVRPKESLRLQTLKQDLTRLIDQMTPTDAVMEAGHSAKYGLTAAMALSEGTSASLPHKDGIAPNQHSWPETAERMGVKQAPKRKRLPEERGLTERSISVAKGKRRRLYEDPYAGGERSGKRAKPDALSLRQMSTPRNLQHHPQCRQIPPTCFP